MNMDSRKLDERKVRMILAVVSVVIIAAILIYALLPYINAFFGGFILFVLFKPLFSFLQFRLGIRKQISALIVLFTTVVLVIFPSYFLIKMVAAEFQYAIANISIVVDYVAVIDEMFPQLGVQETVNEQIGNIEGAITAFLMDIPQRIFHIGIILTIMYFLLYYLLVSEESVMKTIYRVVPFHNEHVAELFNEFKKIVNTTVIATGVVAVVQGGLLTIAFLIFDIEGAYFWGFITGILSILPVVGPPIVWFPAAAFQLVQENYVAGIGILIFGIILSNVDNFIRPFIHHKIGHIHPFIALLGIFIGVSLFGLIGLIIGPLLLMYFVLMVQMFYEEYMQQREECNKQ